MVRASWATASAARVISRMASRASRTTEEVSPTPAMAVAAVLRSALTRSIMPGSWSAAAPMRPTASCAESMVAFAVSNHTGLADVGKDGAQVAQRGGEVGGQGGHGVGGDERIDGSEECGGLGHEVFEGQVGGAGRPAH